MKCLYMHKSIAWSGLEMNNETVSFDVRTQHLLLIVYLYRLCVFICIVMQLTAHLHGYSCELVNNKSNTYIPYSDRKIGPVIQAR